MSVAQDKCRPTAIFAGNNYIAGEAFDLAQGMGLRIPEDLAICGFDGQSLSRHRTPGLTTVAKPITEVGRRAVQIALERFKTKDQPSGPRQVIRLEPSLVVRGSSDPQAARP